MATYLSGLVRRCLTVMLIILLGLVLTACDEKASSSGVSDLASPSSLRGLLGPPPIWEMADTQTISQNAEGRFSLELIIVTYNRLLFFYTLSQLSTSTSPDTANLPKAEISFSPGICPGDKSSNQTRLVAKSSRIQLLGTMGQYQVGVVQVAWENHPGQEVSLAITAPSWQNQGRLTSWQLTPLRQIGPNTPNGPNNQNSISMFKPTHHHDLSVAGPAGSFKNGESYVIAFRMVMIEAPDRVVAPLYIKVDPSDRVTLLSQAEYEKIVGSPLPVLPSFYNKAYPPTPTSPGFMPGATVRCS